MSSPLAPPLLRTRFAPSPTGFMHVGNIRSALYPWAFARSQQGTFILRIEDTDLERSSQEAVAVIEQGLRWLGLHWDEGPFYQMQRMDRYRQVLAQLRASGHIYPCFVSAAELDALREAQMAQKIKPRYDGRWRPEAGKVLPPIPEGVSAVWRFKTPQSGSVIWDDRVKGRIEVNNEELDDLIIARADGTPTYNFCVVVDDIDMRISHVIRGDDHINNTPRQIHVFHALGATPPVYAHLPTVLNADGEKMSKRDPRTKSIMQYQEEGFLPDAMMNYLARLGWSHGDDEIFSRTQFLEWFNLEHLGKSAAQFDEVKLRWVNAQHLKAMSDSALAQALLPFAQARGISETLLNDAVRMAACCALIKDRCETLITLADWVAVIDSAPDFESILTSNDGQSHLVAVAQPSQLRDALRQLQEQLTVCAWDAPSIAAAMKSVLQAQQMKMPQLAMPLRVLMTGRAQTPSVDQLLFLIGREAVLARIAPYLLAAV